MTMESLPERFVDVLVTRLATPEVRMEQRLLLPGIGFGLQRLPSPLCQ